MQYSSTGNTRKDRGKECCMCGDLGFQERLFRCLRCHHRFQHIYCSKLYSDQLEPNVCDWCLHFQAKEKAQSHKRRIELQEMAIRKAKKVVVCNEIVSTSASISSMKQPASRMAIARPASLKLGVKLGGSKQRQPPSLPEDCKLSTESCRNLPATSSTSDVRNTTKGGIRRRYKLLSDVRCS